LIVANNPNENGAGFEHDTNKVSIIAPDGNVEELELMSKTELSEIIYLLISLLYPQIQNSPLIRLLPLSA